MHICDIFAQHRTTFSFEFMPPRTDKAAEQLLLTIRELETLHPSFVSVTYGAGGSTRQRTHDTVVRIKQQTGCDPIPHLTCVCHSEAEIRAILERYAGNGISNVLALSGDVPKARAGHDRAQDAFRYAAELVSYIKRFKFDHSNINHSNINHSNINHSDAGGTHPEERGFGIGVAGFPEGHPATPNRVQEMDNLKAKVDAGADYIVTQLFFDNNDFYDFRERCLLAGIKVPIIAGIMPVTSTGTMHHIPELALGSRYPASLQKAFLRCQGDDDYVRRVGIQWATEQCRDLLDNRVRGIHFYTLNNSTATREIYANLGVKDSRDLE